MTAQQLSEDAQKMLAGFRAQSAGKPLTIRAWFRSLNEDEREKVLSQLLGIVQRAANLYL